jgi:hypothetical protein
MSPSRELLDQLPEYASLEDIQYHIYVRQKIQRGLDAVREGKLISQAEVESKCPDGPRSTLGRTRMGRLGAAADYIALDSVNYAAASSKGASKHSVPAGGQRLGNIY